MDKKNLGFIVLALIFSASAMAYTYSIADISVGTGFVDLYVAEGELRVSVDDDNKIFTVSTYIKDLKGDIKQEFMSVTKLMERKPISFPSDKGKTILVKITGQEDFGPHGGHIKISIKKSDSWSEEILQIARSTKSETYYLWKGDAKIKEIGVNGKESYVNWYEFK